MYFLKDLNVLARIVDEASKSMPDIKPPSPEDATANENIIAGITTIPDSGPSESNKEEEIDHGP